MSKKTTLFSEKNLTLFNRVLTALLVLLLLLQLGFWLSLRSKLSLLSHLDGEGDDLVSDLSNTHNYLSDFASDLNQIRSFLLLPTKDYGFKAPSAEVVEEEEDVEALLFEFVQTLGEYEQNQEEYEAALADIQDWVQEEKWLEDYQLAIQEAGGRSSEEGKEFVFFDSVTGKEVLSLFVDFNAVMRAEGYAEAFSVGEITDFEDLKKAVLRDDHLESYLKDFRAYRLKVDENQIFLTETLVNDESVQAYFNKEGLSLGPANEASQYIDYDVLNGDGTAVASLWVQKVTPANLAVRVNTPLKEFEREEDAWFNISKEDLPAFVAFLEENLDARTEIERLVGERLDMLRHLMEDPAFNLVLEPFGFTFVEGETNETDYVFALQDKEGEVLRWFTLDKATGEFSVKAPGDALEQDLLSATLELQSPGKKKLWTSPRPYLNTLT